MLRWLPANHPMIEDAVHNAHEKVIVAVKKTKAYRSMVVEAAVPERLPGLVPDRPDVVPWLITIAKNAAFDMLEARIAKAIDDEDLGVQAASDIHGSPWNRTTDDSSVRLPVQQAMRLLRSQQAALFDVLFLKYYEGLTAEEIAAAMGMNGSNAAYGQIERAKRALREILEPDDLAEASAAGRPTRF